MTAAETIRAERGSPLPEQMQGRWVFEGDPLSRLVIEGGEIICRGQVVDYDYKEIGREDGALTVTLRVDEDKDEDSFQRANVIGLVVTPEGEFLGYNAKWGARFVRVETSVSPGPRSAGQSK